MILTAEATENRRWRLRPTDGLRQKRREHEVLQSSEHMILFCLCDILARTRIYTVT